MPTTIAIIAWLNAHDTLLVALGTLSVLLLLLGVFGMPWLLARLPSDYFVPGRAVSRATRRHTSRPPSDIGSPLRGAFSLLLLAARNLVGVLLVLLGLVMMVTPGPGLIALLLGLSLCEFPGKHPLLRRLATHPDVFSSLNWLRRRAGAGPFEHPDTPAGRTVGGPVEAADNAMRRD